MTTIPTWNARSLARYFIGLGGEEILFDFFRHIRDSVEEEEEEREERERRLAAYRNHTEAMVAIPTMIESVMSPISNVVSVFSLP